MKIAAPALPPAALPAVPVIPPPCSCRRRWNAWGLRLFVFLPAVTLLATVFPGAAAAEDGSRPLSVAPAAPAAPSAPVAPAASTPPAAPTPPGGPALPPMVPAENIAEGGAPARQPDWDSAEKLGMQYVALLNGQAGPEGADDAAFSLQAGPLFFPREPFLTLKALPDPGAYHGQLLKEYAGHLRSQRRAAAARLPVQYLTLKKGFCKWKAVKSEYNHVPYWSCYRNLLQMTDKDGKPFELPVKVLINWGRDWYITHLGPAASAR